MIPFFYEYSLTKSVIKAIFHTEMGLYHAKNNLPNQDALARGNNKARLIAAIADGVGSCIHSEDGANKAVLGAKELIHSDDLSDKSIKSTILNYWRSNIAYSENECCSTLRFAMMSENEIILGSIGDGITLFLTETVLYQMKDDYWFANYTNALPMVAGFNVERFPLKSGIIVMLTDGIANEIDPDQEYAFCEYVKQSMEMAPYEFIEEIENWVASLQENNGDDKTLAFISIEKKKGEEI